MKKEMHVFLDSREEYKKYEDLIITNVCDLYSTMCNNKVPIVYTTLTCFFDFFCSETLFVHVDGKQHEITLGNCDGTNREIRLGHNIEKLLLAGEFDWFRGDFKDEV